MTKAAGEKSKELEKKLFEQFNERGSRLSVRERGAEVFFEAGIIDSVRVLRVATHDGEDGQADFWLLLRNAGWWTDPDQQYTHLVKILSWRYTNDGIRLFSDNGSVMDLDFLWAEDDLRLWEKIVKERTAEWKEKDERQADYIREEYIPLWWGAGQ